MITLKYFAHDLPIKYRHRSQKSACKTIIYLKEKETFKDPRKQWVNHLKRKL